MKNLEELEERLKRITENTLKSIEDSEEKETEKVILLSGIFAMLNLSNKIAIYNLKKEGK